LATPADRLESFVRDALSAGRTRDEIAGALSAAGWSAAEIDAALASWAQGPFSPPVPRPRAYVSAAEAFLYGLIFVALAMTAWHLTALLFQLVDRWVPDPGETVRALDNDGMRLSIAFLVVFFPVFLLLNWRAERASRADPGKRRSAVRKWFSYVTLFLAALGLLGDLIAVIYAFLSGELTLRFALKAASVAAVAGAVLLYFRAELDEASSDAA
jgi:hypothetical protein